MIGKQERRCFLPPSSKNLKYKRVLYYEAIKLRYIEEPQITAASAVFIAVE
jgi:hypothetical protein